MVLGLQGGALVADLPGEGGLRIRTTVMINIDDKDKIKDIYDKDIKISYQALRLGFYRSSRDTQS